LRAARRAGCRHYHNIPRIEVRPASALHCDGRTCIEQSGSSDGLVSQRKQRHAILGPNDLGNGMSRWRK
jgi:hypothetical protein